MTLCNHSNQTPLHVSLPVLQEVLLSAMFRALPHQTQLLQAAWQGDLHSLQHLLVSPPPPKTPLQCLTIDHTHTRAQAHTKRAHSHCHRHWYHSQRPLHCVTGNVIHNIRCLSNNGGRLEFRLAQRTALCGCSRSSYEHSICNHLQHISHLTYLCS